MRFESLGGYQLLVVRFEVVFCRPYFVNCDKNILSCTELIKHYATKAYGGDPYFLDLGTSWR
jgi:hypothetical protein